MYRPAIGLSVTLYIASLFFPVFLFDGQEPVMGHTVLLSGWWGIVLVNVGWLANIAWVMSIWKAWKKSLKPAFLWSLAAAILSLEGFVVNEWWFTEASGTPVRDFGPGFYLWFIAIMISFIGNGLAFKKPSPSPNQ